MKRQQRVFDNEHVSFLHRRFQEYAFESLKNLRQLTMEFATSAGAEQWPKLWSQNLPTVAYHNTLIQQDMAKGLLDAHPCLVDYAETAYQLYARHTYGRDINGNVNVLHVTFPPFYEFFHTFLTWLCKHPAVSRLEIFSNFEILDAASRAAFCDALCIVLKNRVSIRQTLTKAQYQEQYVENGGGKTSNSDANRTSRSKSPASSMWRSKISASTTTTAASAFSKTVRRYEEEAAAASDDKRRGRSPSSSTSREKHDDDRSAYTPKTPVPIKPQSKLPGKTSTDLRGGTKSSISSFSKPSVASSVAAQNHWIKHLKHTSSVIVAPSNKRLEILPSESASQLMSTGKLFQRDQRSGSTPQSAHAPTAPALQPRQVTIVKLSSSGSTSTQKSRSHDDDTDSDSDKKGDYDEDDERSKRTYDDLDEDK